MMSEICWSVACIAMYCAKTTVVKKLTTIPGVGISSMLSLVLSCVYASDLSLMLGFVSFKTDAQESDSTHSN